MKKFIAIAGAGVLALSLAGCGGGAGGDEGAAAKAVETAMNALINGDIEAYCANTVTEDGPARPKGSDDFKTCVDRMEPLIQQVQAQLKDMGIGNMKISTAKVDGDRATIPKEAVSGDFDPALLVSDETEARKVDGQWYMLVEEW